MLISICAVFAVAFAQQTDCSIKYENHNQIDYRPLHLRVLTGVLVDIDSVPLSHVCLVLFDDKAPSVVATTTSHDGGNFSFGAVSRGKYRLVVNVPGFGVANVPVTLVAWPSGGFLRHASLTIRMRPSGIDTTSYGERRK
jgi:hypothetical protein